MLKSSSVRRTGIRSERIAAGVFIAGAVLCAVIFARGIAQDRILSGTFTYGLVCAVAAWGLWRLASWARTLALIVVVGNVGLGALQLVAVVVSGRGNVLTPVVVLVVSVLLGYLLGRSPAGATQDGATQDGA